MCTIFRVDLECSIEQRMLVVLLLSLSYVFWEAILRIFKGMEISWNVNFLVLFYFAWVVIRSIYISRALSRQYLNWQIIILCAFWQANERFCEIGGFVVEQNTIYSSRHNHFSGNATNMKLNKKKNQTASPFIENTCQPDTITFSSIRYDRFVNTLPTSTSRLDGVLFYCHLCFVAADTIS